MLEACLESPCPPLLKMLAVKSRDPGGLDFSKDPNRWGHSRNHGLATGGTKLAADGAAPSELVWVNAAWGGRMLVMGLSRERSWEKCRELFFRCACRAKRP
jgi:hypothetical protein